ncbi:hypothetical protein A9Q83_00440 [Alphaproteobacteria bacterium 46_93_T64]|nr:hypothetical protein A9Q83_00440 [Alphaproteobacteria bacterium 46_93_T64]
MFGIVIDYDFSGDEATWQQAVDTFIGNIDADARLKGRFRYMVTARKDGTGRVHIGQWDEEETLAHLQSQPFFGEFAGKVKEFAGDSLKATPFKTIAQTSG